MGNSSSESGWFDIRPLEWWLSALALFGGVALHFPAVYYPFGFYIEAVLCIVSFLTPISGMFWLSAAQVIPDPPIGPMSSSQMAILGAIIALIIRTNWRALIYSKPFLLAMAPFFVWQTAMNFFHGGDLQSPLLLIYAAVTGALAAMMTGMSGKRVGACLAAFLAGQALCACVFWIIKLGLGAPVQAFDVTIYGDSLETIRRGTGRGNAGVLAPSAALAIVGFVGLLMFRPPKKRRGINHTYWILFALALLGLCLVAPALPASGSRGGMISVVFGILILGLFAHQCRSLSMVSFGIGLLGIAFVLIFGWTRFGLEENWEEARERQEAQEEMVSNASLIAGRELEWTAAWNGILDSPIFGGGRVTKLSYAGSEGLWASHSTYLDVGLGGGIPGILLFVWFCIIPLKYLWEHRREGVFLWLLSVYITILACNGSGSALQVKYFWILWGIASVLPITFKPHATALGRRLTRPNLLTKGTSVPIPRQDAPA